MGGRPQVLHDLLSLADRLEGHIVDNRLNADLWRAHANAVQPRQHDELEQRGGKGAASHDTNLELKRWGYQPSHSDLPRGGIHLPKPA